MMAEKTLPWADWEIVRRLGGGSYGTVYEIRRERYGIVERAAMKVISFPKDAEEVEDQRRSGFTDESLVNSYRQQMQRFLDEYRLMLELKGKTNIVSCDDFQTVPHADGIGWDIFIKMELLTPLKKYLARKITPEQTVKLGIDLCKALSLCREKDIIHRDIKPDNILVSDSGDFKLGDFGVAKTAERTMAGTRTGTPNFTAPEVYHNEPYGKSVDIYSLGMVLYWMLNRRALPFLPLPPQMPSPDEMQEALLRRMRGEALPRPVDGSRALQDVVLKACAYDPADRYASPEELCRALEAARAADTSMADTVPDVQPDAPAVESSFPDTDATMGNNWETGSQTEAQPELTDLDATEATMGTCGTMQSPLPDAPTPQQIHRDSDKPPVPEKEVSSKNKKGKRAATKRSLNKKRLLTVASVVVLAVVAIIIVRAGRVSYSESGNLVRITGSVTVEKLIKAQRLMNSNECDRLRIYNNTRFNADAMEYLGAMMNLRHLELYLQDNFYDKEIDLSPLSHLTYQLESLSLCCHKIPDLGPLSGLTNLTYLSLSCKNDFDLFGLSDLTNLTSLSLDGCESISDLGSLSALTNLTRLDLGNCKKVSDLGPLSGLTNLTFLSLDGCESISDLGPLSALTNLISLNLDDCKKVSDLSPLSSLKKLGCLYISGTNVTSLNGVENMVKLLVLEAKGCKLHDTSALEVSGRRKALQQ